MSYGGSTAVSVGVGTTSVDSLTGGGIVELYLVGAGATNAQLMSAGMYITQASFGAGDRTRGGGAEQAIAIDSTLPQTLDVAANMSAGGTMVVSGYTIEKVS